MTDLYGLYVYGIIGQTKWTSTIFMCLKNVFFDINTISKQMGCALQIGSSHRITSLVKFQRLDNAWWCHLWQLWPWLLSCLPNSLLDIS